MKKRIFLYAIGLVVMMAPIGCQAGPFTAPQVSTFSSPLELFTQKSNLEEAAQVMGITVPAPAYLPTGFEIQEVYVSGRSARLLISDGPIERKLVTHTDAAGTRQRYELKSKIEMSISWSAEFMIPVRLPVEKVNIKGRPGYLQETGTHRSLLWNWFTEQENLGVFELGLEAGKGISKEELIEIAESVAFKGAPELYTPRSDQVISDRLYDIDKGEFRYLSIYQDGSLIAIQMDGLLEPVDQHVRILKTGELGGEELNSLIEFFEDSGFKEMDKNNEFSGSSGSEVHYSVSALLGSSYRSIKASNYLSPDGGKTYPDMPYPLNEIYQRLKDIAENRTEEVTRESL